LEHTATGSAGRTGKPIMSTHHQEDPATTDGTRIAVAADYLTVRGGAERVAVAMLDAFPRARVLTALYEPDATYPEFGTRHIETLWPNRFASLRRDVRRAFPLLASTWSHTNLDADVTFASSAGWAHGVRSSGRKIVYCHNPARWLYQKDDYFAGVPATLRHLAASLDLPLRRWDQRAARSADYYLVNSSSVRRRVEQTYGIDAEILHPPVTIDPNGQQDPMVGVEPGFLLTVSRPRGYKNTALLAEAVTRMTRHRLVVVGKLPEGHMVDAGRVLCVSDISDSELRWLYANASALLAASIEDFGLTPIEANSFGTPVVALRSGGYLDSVVEGVNGVFFDRNDVHSIAGAIDELTTAALDPIAIAEHADNFSLQRFTARLHELAAEFAK